MKFVLQFIGVDVEFLRENLCKMTSKKVWVKIHMKVLLGK